MLELDDKRRSMHMYLSEDLQIILDWGIKNLVQFNASKTQSCSLSQKKSTNTHPIFMNGTSLQNKGSFDLVGVAFEHDLSWHGHITSIVTSGAKKLGFLFRTRRYFSSLNLYTLYVSQIRPCLEYYSYIWRAAPPSTLSILDSIQRKAIRLIDDPVLTGRLPSLAHRRRRAVGDLSLFYRYFHRLCSEELASIIPSLAVRSRVTFICILIPSSCRSPEHPITCVSSYPGCPDYGTPCLRMFSLPLLTFSRLSPVYT